MAEQNILEIAKEYIKALSAGKSGNEIAHFFATDALQIEYPNSLNPNGGESDFDTLLIRSEKAKGFIEKQNNEIHREYIFGNTVALEITWTATFKIPIGKTQPGEIMKVNFAVFLEFKDDKIVRQRNYDCFHLF